MRSRDNDTRLICAGTVALACAWLGGAKPATDDRQLLSVGPLAYGFLTLRSGRTFKYLGTGPIIAKDGKPLALGVNYVTDAGGLDQLKSEAAELFEYVRPLAEATKEKGVVIIAHFDFEPGHGSAATYNIVYTKGVSGKWELLAPHPDDKLPGSSRSSPQVELQRDQRGESDANACAQGWLKLVDGELHGESWEAAAPLLKGMVSKSKWVTLASTWTSAFGKAESRTLVSTLSTRHVSDAPEGSYVVFEYRTKFSKRPTGSERVVTMLCEDRQWRVAGYSRSD